jgi:RecA-family ATPase
MDGENGIGQVATMVQRLSAHLGLDSAPDNLLLWNLNDAPPHGNTVDFLTKVIQEVQPVWVIIDPINSLFNDIEKDAMTATKYYQEVRGLMSKYQCAFSGVHHLRKGSDNPDDKPESLERPTSRRGLPERGGVGF